MSNIKSQFTTTFTLRPYTTKELRTIFQLSRTAFTDWMKPIREKFNMGKRNLLNINEVKAFIDLHGVPGELKLF